MSWGYWNSTFLNVAHGMIATSNDFMHVLCCGPYAVEMLGKLKRCGQCPPKRVGKSDAISRLLQAEGTGWAQLGATKGRKSTGRSREEALGTKKTHIVTVHCDDSMRPCGKGNMFVPHGASAAYCARNQVNHPIAEFGLRGEAPFVLAR
jgi:hypothetical protein